MQSSQLKFKNLFIVMIAFLILGALVGYSIVQILSAIATPNFDHYFMTKELFTLMFGAGQPATPLFNFATLIGEYFIVFIGLSIAIVIGIFTLWFKLVLPETATAWKSKRYKTFLIIITMVLALSYITDGAFVMLNETVFELSSMDTHISSFPYLSTILLFAAFLILFSATRWIERQSHMITSSYTSIIIFSLFGTIVATVFNLYLSTITEQFFKSMFAIGEAGETTVLGWQRINTAVIFISAVSLTFLATFATWLIRPKPLQNLFIPLILATLIVIPGQYFMHFSNHNLDMQYATLTDAAGLKMLPNPPAESTIIVLDNVTSPHIETISLRSDNIYGIAPSGLVDLIPDNRQQLYDYIQKDRFTYYTDTAMNALVEISKREWNQEEYRKANQHAIDNNGGVIYGMFLLASVTDAPVTPENRALLTRLSDENTYIINGKSAYKIAKSWVTFGDLEKAKYFYDHAVKTLDKEDFTAWDELVPTYRFNTGSISGEIKGEQVGAKVALINGDVNGAPSFHKIKGVIELNDSYRFTFDHLPAGTYTLAVMLPNGAKSPKKVVGGGKFNISPESPEQKVNVRFEY